MAHDHERYRKEGQDREAQHEGWEDDAQGARAKESRRDLAPRLPGGSGGERLPTASF